MYRALADPAGGWRSLLKEGADPADEAVPTAPSTKQSRTGVTIMSEASQQIVKVMCPNLGCQRILAVPVRARGEVVRCQGCNSNIRIPRVAASVPKAGPGPSQAA